MAGSTAQTGRRSPLLLALSMHWIRGAIGLAVVLALWVFLSTSLPGLHDRLGGAGSVAAVGISFFVVPTLVGWLGERLLNPLLRNWRSTGGLVRWTDRMVEELAPDERQPFPVAAVPWPSREVRTLGVVTNTYAGAEGEGEQAAVFIPNTPNARSGFLRVVPSSDLEYTDWKFVDLLQFHISYGAGGPRALRDLADQPPKPD